MNIFIYISTMVRKIIICGANMEHTQRKYRAYTKNKNIQGMTSQTSEIHKLLLGLIPNTMFIRHKIGKSAIF